MLVDEGLLLRRNGSLAASGELSQLSLPPTIQALLAARLDRLGREDRARPRARLGRRQGLPSQRGRSSCRPRADRPRVDGQLAMLLDAGVSRGRAERASPTSEAFRFRHQLLRDVAYGSLSKAVRAELHERFAGWLEGKAGRACRRVRGDPRPPPPGGLSLQDRPRSDRRARTGSSRRERAPSWERRLRAHARGDMWGASKLLVERCALPLGAMAPNFCRSSMRRSSRRDQQSGKAIRGHRSAASGAGPSVIDGSSG